MIIYGKKIRKTPPFLVFGGSLKFIDIPTGGGKFGDVAGKHITY